MTLTRIRAILPSTATEYKIYAWKKGIKPQSVDLGDGASGHWIGDPNAKNVLIWIHGKPTITLPRKWNLRQY